MDSAERMMVHYPRVFFDPSALPDASIHRKPNTHFADSNLSKDFGPCLVEKASSSRNLSPISVDEGGRSSGFSEVVGKEEMNRSDDASGEYLDWKSDANTTQIGGEMSQESNCGDEDCVHEILYEKSVKMKLELLAAMVGVGSSQPSEVLTKVVRALKDLERQWKIVSEDMRSSGAKW